MAARGGKRNAEKLAELLNPLIHNEVATIGVIDTVAPMEKEPGYVVLMRATKLGKQASLAQMSSMLRRANAPASLTGTPFEPMMKLQSLVAQRIGTTPLLRAMRLAEAAIVRAYAAAYDEVDGIEQKGLEKCWHRAIKHLAVLTAHIAKRGAKPEIEEQLSLPMTLDRYFAHDEDRVCFRCLFDRPGHLPPLERADPHPYTYVCAACHEEVLTDFPADMLDSIYGMSEEEREAHVIERALSRPSKLTAEHLIIAKMSGLAPDLPPRPIPYKEAQDVSPKRRTAKPPAPRVDLGGSEIAESLEEQTYVEALFDYTSVRANW